MFTIIEREPPPYSSASSKLSFESRSSGRRRGISYPSGAAIGDVGAGGMGGGPYKRNQAGRMYEDQGGIYTSALGEAGAYGTGPAPIMDQKYSVPLTNAQACSDIDMPNSLKEDGRSVFIDRSMTLKIAMFIRFQIVHIGCCFTQLKKNKKQQSS